MKVAIQGIKGSFHHIVAEQYFGNNFDLVECMSFSEIPDLLLKNKANVAVMAIENSIAGAILPNYALIDDNNLLISGEHYLPIYHNLMALEGQSIDEIEEVYSHPMALLQCHQFFKSYPHIKLIEDKDTAEVARRIKKKKLTKVAAIASILASEIYGLEILASDIQTVKNNATRFVFLNNGTINSNPMANKASVKFLLEHHAGSLGEVLNIFSKNNVNLTKIQSMPIIDTPWEYAFFVDVIFDNYGDYQNALSSVKKKVTSIKILGEYTKNKQ